MVQPVAGVVLAAGASTRMGRNKLLLKLEGVSLLRRAATRALDAGLAPVLVVLGHDADRARHELDGLAVRIVLNPSYRLGMSRSLAAGLEALPVETPAAVVLLADMPFVTADMLATLVDRYRRCSAAMVVSDYEGVQAPPALYARSLFPQLIALSGDSAGRQVVARHRESAEVITWPAAARLDVDDLGDYERARGGAPT